MRFLAVTILLFAFASTASAQRYTGRFVFIDSDGTDSPIAEADIEIWRYRPTSTAGWQWHRDLSFQTTPDGRIDVWLPFWAPGTINRVRVYAANRAVAVHKQDVITEVFSRNGSASAPLDRVSMSSADTHDFSFFVDDEPGRVYFNAADAIRFGYKYATTHRDPREVDPIERVSVYVGSHNTTVYNQPSKTIWTSAANANNDMVMLHEYGHALEHMISGYQAIASDHRGCDAFELGTGRDVTDQIAWVEGFADYFAWAVRRVNPEINGSYMAIEHVQCGGIRPKSEYEAHVAAALYDLVDDNNEYADSHCGSAGLDTIVFQIFDRELDIGRNPDLQLFADAWRWRGYDLPLLKRTFSASGIQLATPVAVTHYAPGAATTRAIWRPSNGEWWVRGASSVPVWGLQDDIPVPADYDGDGQTDVAVWRPRDGTWWVINTATNAMRIQQWGLTNDIPLPGDYDGDGEDDFAVYRPSDGLVYVHSDNCGPSYTVAVGSGKPFKGDFDGDGIDEPGVLDPQNRFRVAGRFYLDPPIGVGIPVIGNYDSDAYDDLASWNPADGLWRIHKSSSWVMTHTYWGWSGDVPVPGDYDADGFTDVAVWRPSTGEWWIRRANGDVIHDYWGWPTDIAVPR